MTRPHSEQTEPGTDQRGVRPWATTEPGRLVGRGHPAGDFLEAWAWDLLEEADGYVRVSAHLPDHVRNPRGQLFGGFTPTYVDLIALFTVRSRATRAAGRGFGWLATTSMRVDYFEPIVGPKFILESRREKQRGRTYFVVTKFFQDDELAVLATTTMREVAQDRPLGDA
jgi:acyl-coenzyme A thioesterase PaaI-like protein